VGAVGEQETIWAAADALRAWIERYGVPLALYVDWKNLHKRPATPSKRARWECRSWSLRVRTFSRKTTQERKEAEHKKGDISKEL